jgi:hypothetical protein
VKHAAVVGLRVLALAGIAGLGLAPAAFADHESDHTELRALLASVREAINNNRFDDMTPLLAKGFSITMVDQSVITEPAQLKQYFHRYFQAEGSPLQSLHIEPAADVLTEFLDDNTGVNRGSSADTYTLKSGRQILVNSRWSGTFRKVDEHWKIQSLHVGVNMIDNPILTAASMARYLWAGGGLAVGLLLGVVGSRLTRSAA